MSRKKTHLGIGTEILVGGVHAQGYVQVLLHPIVEEILQRAGETLRSLLLLQCVKVLGKLLGGVQSRDLAGTQQAVDHLQKAWVRQVVILHEEDNTFVLQRQELHQGFQIGFETLESIICDIDSPTYERWRSQSLVAHHVPTTNSRYGKTGAYLFQ